MAEEVEQIIGEENKGEKEENNNNLKKIKNKLNNNENNKKIIIATIKPSAPIIIEKSFVPENAAGPSTSKTTDSIERGLSKRVVS